MRFHVAFSHHDLARATSLGPDASSAALGRLRDLARAAEGGGADSIWINEDPEGWDAFAIGTMLAGSTSTIRVGTGVTNPINRHPNLIAASLATLDLVSGGRAFLGIGRGEPEWYRDGLGMAVPRSPVLALERGIRLLRAWWQPPYRVQRADDDVSVDDPFPVRDWERSIHPWPGRKTGPPIYVAAAGPRALAVAGTLGDGVLFNDLASDEYLAWAIRQVREAAARADRDLSGFRFIYGTPVALTADRETILRRRTFILVLVNALPGMERQLRTSAFDTDAIIAEVRHRLGTTEGASGAGGFPGLRRRGTLGLARDAVPLELVDALSVVGDVHHVRRRLATVSDLGVTDVFVELPGRNESADQLRGTIAQLRALPLR